MSGSSDLDADPCRCGMTRPLCAGKPFDWWIPGDGGNRLAMMICGVCVGCPDDDPTPHGVIRQGVPYSDAGNRIPLCPNCDRPHMGYAGGNLTLCRLCAVPNVPLPSDRLTRADRILALAKQNVSDEDIAAQVGMAASSVGKVRRSGGIRRRAASLPVPAVAGVA